MNNKKKQLIEDVGAALFLIAVLFVVIYTAGYLPGRWPALHDFFDNVPPSMFEVLK